MTERRQVHIYSAGCAVCEDAVGLVRDIACPSCEITVRDMNDPAVAAEARALGIARVPAVVIDGKLADCCAKGGPDREALKAAGIGTPMG
ncbi:MAG: thioredoxin family protein [Magnetovibrio sp.]|nr:thioredoxin family protein [Magnetovibrio sp.]